MRTTFGVLFSAVIVVGDVYHLAVAADAASASSPCVIPDNMAVSADGACGKWSVNNDEPADEEKARRPTTLIDFSHLTDDNPGDIRPERPLTIVRVCIEKGHNSHADDYLMIRTQGSRDQKSNQVWLLDWKNNSTGCRYLPLRPGMKITGWLTDFQSEITAPGRSASGTWAIVK